MIHHTQRTLLEAFCWLRFAVGIPLSKSAQHAHGTLYCTIRKWRHVLAP